jgi:hypothetical protein
LRLEKYFIFSRRLDLERNTIKPFNPYNSNTSRKMTSEHQAIVSKLGSKGPFGHQALDTIAWCSKVTFLLV